MNEPMIKTRVRAARRSRFSDCFCRFFSTLLVSMILRRSHSWVGCLFFDTGSAVRPLASFWSETVWLFKKDSFSKAVWRSAKTRIFVLSLTSDLFPVKHLRQLLSRSAAVLDGRLVEFSMTLASFCTCLERSCKRRFVSKKIWMYTNVMTRSGSQKVPDEE